MCFWRKDFQNLVTMIILALLICDFRFRMTGKRQTETE
jgi:hypothetical protein